MISPVHIAEDLSGESKVSLGAWGDERRFSQRTKSIKVCTHLVGSQAIFAATTAVVVEPPTLPTHALFR